MRRRLGPPKLATAWITRRLAAHAWRESILGDLDEEHAAITRRRGRLAADLWYWQQAILEKGTEVIFLDARAGKLPLSPLRGFMSELRLAVRSAFKRPAHTVLVVVALALGLGLNAAVFGMGDALLFRPFPIDGVDRLVVVGDKRPAEFGNLAQSASPANFLDWHAASGPGAPVDQFAAWEFWNANLTGGTQPERVQAFRVSPGFFRMMGASIAHGREFEDGDAVAGNHRVVVLSRGLWERRFGSDPTLVGRTVTIEGFPYTVVGIAPARFAFPNGSEAWVPLSFDAEEAAVRRSRYLTVAARLTPGASTEQARAHMAVVAANLKAKFPAENGAFETHVEPLAQGLGDPGVSNIMIVWQLSAFLVLLIACANVASLLLARGAARAREIAVRLAMGASRWRVVRQLLAESLVLAALAVPLSLGLAWWLLRVLKSYMPPRIASFVLGWSEIDLDGRVVLFTAVAAVMTTVIFGLLPALQSSSFGGNTLDMPWYRRRAKLPRHVRRFPRTSLVDTLKQGGRGSTTGRLRLRRALVIAEIALALPLLVAAGMTSLGTYRFINGPQGYDPEGLLTFRMSLPAASYATADDRARFAQRAVDAFSEIPGVTHAAATNVIPSSGSGSGTRYEIEGEPPPAPDTQQSADLRLVSPAYFDAMRLPLLRGRGFTAADTRDTMPVALVSASFAAKHWPNQDPIGRRIIIPNRERTVLTVVGTTGDHIHDWFGRRNFPTIFRPASQGMGASMGFILRTTGSPEALTAPARAALARIDPAQPIYQVLSQSDQVRERAIGPRYAAGLMSLFGALALVLSVIGVYALVGHFVTQRRQEIGVRMALGARSADVVRLTVRQAATMAAIGVAIGGAAAWALSRVLEANLMGMAQNDPRLLAGFAVVLTLAALIAGYVPARRAAAIDPMLAMRGD